MGELPCYYFWRSIAHCQNIHDGVRACFLWGHQSLHQASKFSVDGLVFDCLFPQWLLPSFCLLNMRRQHITAVSPEVFCFWLLTWKCYLIHPLFIDIIVIFSRVLRPILEVRFKNELIQLIVMSVIFSTTKVLYNISGLGGLAIFKRPADLPDTCRRFFIDGYSVQFYCIKGKWHHRRHLY